MGKKPRSGNVYGQYLNECNVVSSSHFDFIIKFPDNNTSNNNYLYIEVKGGNDIDASKTERLRKAYGQYFAPAFNRNSQQELGDIKIVICIAEVDGDNITHECFYECNKFGGKNLNSMTFGGVLQALSTNLS